MIRFTKHLHHQMIADCGLLFIIQICMFLALASNFLSYVTIQKKKISFLSQQRRWGKMFPPLTRLSACIDRYQDREWSIACPHHPDQSGRGLCHWCLPGANATGGNQGRMLPRGLREVASSMVLRKWLLPKANLRWCIPPSSRLHCDLKNAGQDSALGWAPLEFTRNPAWFQELVLSNELLGFF